MEDGSSRRRRPGAVALLLAAVVVGGGLLVAAVPLFWVAISLGWAGSLTTIGVIVVLCVTWVGFASSRRSP